MSPGVKRTSRDVARSVIARVDQGGAYATLALDGELARTDLDDRDRRLAAELTYGTLRHRPRLERAVGALADLGRAPPAVRHALLVGAYQILMMRTPAHAAVDDAVGAVRARHGAKLAGFVNAVLRKLSQSGEPPLPADPRARLAIEHSLPPWIVDELAAQLHPDELADAAAALAAPAPIWARVNVARATVADVVAALEAEGATVAPSRMAPSALQVKGLGDPAASPSFQAGKWTVQDLGAQLIGTLTAPRPGSRVLDACAGLGGKTTHLAELAASAGPAAHIDAVDRAAAKLVLLESGARRLGLSGIRTITGDLTASPPGLAPAYDVVLLDAPCSGLGVLRRHPEAKARVTAADVASLARSQTALLDAAAARVASGGVLVYAVCTFTRAEGADQLAAFLARHEDFTVEAPAGHAHVDETGAIRTWPHRDGADAFFAVRLRRAILSR
ncbi:MAG TPA: 16S rRNA (cytosine(967)-C(5))-methyltransferase RsmB [Kofleriaceae bacterium]|nr:16S rRNA (cytosine(967)-C(5))-methyltransferase RsmB [Kofleriaceae bacterium]